MLCVFISAQAQGQAQAVAASARDAEQALLAVPVDGAERGRGGSGARGGQAGHAQPESPPTGDVNLNLEKRTLFHARF